MTYILQDFGNYIKTVSFNRSSGSDQSSTSESQSDTDPEDGKSKNSRKGKPRSDSLRTLLMRFILKLPNQIRDEASSRHFFKKSELRVYLYAYCKAYRDWLLPNLGVPKSGVFLGFIEFCILSFPAAKVEKLLNSMKASE